ncbi:MAG: glycosyltransferase [Lachnospiraceae bacterium]|nr:glycosyltransferase [Lachnospiraceae bacterium]
MKKILFVINTLGRGGAENALIQLIKKIDKNEYDISLFVVLGQGELIEKIPSYVHILNEGYDSSSVLSKEGKKNLKKNIFKKLFKKAALLKNVFYIISNFFAMLFKGRVMPDKLLWKTLSDACPAFDEEFDLAVAYLEGAAAYYVKDYVNAKKKAAFIHTNYQDAGYTRKLDKSAYISFDRIFTVSEDARESFLSVYPECSDRTCVFDNIIDKDGILKKAEENGGFEDNFTGKRILTIARLTPPKAVDVSIEACKILIEKKENIKWYVLGDGELRSRLEDLIERYNLKDSFILLGVKDNPYTYLKQCDLYVHASRSEGKSIAIREAQVMKKPMIVSDCRSNLEQVTDEEDALVSGLDPAELSDKIIRLLNDESLCKRLGENAGRKFIDGTENIAELLSLTNQD